MTNAQDLSKPLGKIHRVNDDGIDAEGQPVREHAERAAVDLELRPSQPAGAGVGSGTGLLWESEHGPNGGDEINIIEKGKNYGWGVISMGMQNGITERSRAGHGAADRLLHADDRAERHRVLHRHEVSRLEEQPVRRRARGAATAPPRDQRTARSSTRKPVFQQFGRVRAVTTGPDGLLYVLLQNPTGIGHGARLSASTPGHGHSAWSRRNEVDRFRRRCADTLMNRTRISPLSSSPAVVGFAAAIAGAGHGQDAGQRLAAGAKADGRSRSRCPPRRR